MGVSVENGAGATKPAHEGIVSRKKGDSALPDIFFNDISIERASHQDFGIYLDEKINFKCTGVIHQVHTQNFPEK